MNRNTPFLGEHFGSSFQPQLGSFDAVPISGPPTGWIAVPFATIKFGIYNRYLPQYWPPYIPVEAAPGQSVILRAGG